MTSQVRSVQIKKIATDQQQTTPDLLAIEEPLEIRIGFGPTDDRQQKSLSVTMRTPGHDFELASGFLFTEGIIQDFGQLESIKYCEDVGRQEEKGNVVRVELKPEVEIDFKKLQRHFYTSSSCGVCGKSSINSVRVICQKLNDQFSIKKEVIHTLSDSLRKAQHVFEYTGGLHAVGLFSAEGELILLREDVGRHNALDKLIGAMLYKKDIPLSNHVLFVSGRASFELVQKAAVAGVSVFAAVGAPSSLAVDLAKEFGMTLLGFVRDNRFNIYCGDERLA
jgi:FdhD protein